MTYQEIQDIALRCAKETVGEAKMPEALAAKVLKQITITYTNMFTSLSRDYCIVSKTKVKRLCRLTAENGSSDDYGLIDGLTDLVSEMFNEEYHEEMENLNNKDNDKRENYQPDRGR